MVTLPECVAALAEAERLIDRDTGREEARAVLLRHLQAFLADPPMELKPLMRDYEAGVKKAASFLEFKPLELPNGIFAKQALAQVWELIEAARRQQAA